MRKLKERFIKLCRGSLPGEIEEFAHQKRLQSLGFSIKRVSIVAIVAFSFAAISILLNPEKYQNENPVELILICGFSLSFLLIFGYLYSRAMKKLLERTWKWRKNKT